MCVRRWRTFSGIDRRNTRRLTPLVWLPQFNLKKANFSSRFLFNIESIHLFFFVAFYSWYSFNERYQILNKIILTGWSYRMSDIMLLLTIKCDIFGFRFDHWSICRNIFFTVNYISTMLVYIKIFWEEVNIFSVRGALCIPTIEIFCQITFRK